MKYLLLFLISFSLFAGYVAPNKNGFFKSKAKCEKKHGVDCYEVKYKNGLNHLDFDLVDEYIDDIEKPVYSKTSIETCLDQVDCESKLALKYCAESEHKYINAQFTEIYCSKLLRYEQKLSGRKVLQVNDLRKQSRLDLEAQKEAKSNAVNTALKQMDKGRKIIGLMLVLNYKKNLTKGQIRNMNKTYAEIKDLLETGSLQSAHEAISELIPDGVIVTNEDKSSMLEELSSLMVQ